ncbi:MAG: hypothetical protein LBF93_06375 [Zoogloeaceae bacterium]|jgi:hypothetical protein|nr:hypothetical protein [Zoogloeaceae bacterium]
MDIDPSNTGTEHQKNQAGDDLPASRARWFAGRFSRFAERPRLAAFLLPCRAHRRQPGSTVAQGFFRTVEDQGKNPNRTPNTSSPFLDRRRDIPDKFDRSSSSSPLPEVPEKSYILRNVPPNSKRAVLRGRNQKRLLNLHGMFHGFSFSCLLISARSS